MEKTKASDCFRKCLPPCPRFLTPEDTYDLCVMCLGEECARSVLEGSEYTHCDKLSIRKLPSHLSLFSRDEGQVSVSRSSGSAAAEAQHKLRLWGLKVKLADRFEKFMDLSKASAVSSGARRDLDTLSLGSSESADNATLG